MNLELITQIFSDAIAAALPESNLTVSQWAARYRFLPASRAQRSGLWSNAVVPFLTGIMDAVTNPLIQEIVFVKSSQVGGSELAVNVISYYIHADPSPVLFVAETEGKAKAWSQESLAPTIQATPVLRALIREQRGRDEDNSIYSKAYPGGHLAVGWATSAATLSSRPRRIVICDERDAFGATSEGDPVLLAEKRTATFYNKKIIKISTPRLRSADAQDPSAPWRTPIEREYDATNQCRYYVPCPHCGTFQILKWASVRWDKGQPYTAFYVCEAGCLIEHEEKAGMLGAGEWRPENADAPPHRVGFWINELYSPFESWGGMAERWERDHRDPEKLQVFVNTSLAAGWEPRQQAVDVSDLRSRSEAYGFILPAGVRWLTAGVDVQANRLECEIVGWGLDDESWSVDYQVLMGDPGQAEVWHSLATLMAAEYVTETGAKLRVGAVGLDTGGSHTADVYQRVRQNAGRRWFALKGASTSGKALVSRPNLVGRPPVHLYAVGTEAAKDKIAAWLAVTEPGPGYCHFPADYPDSYFAQLRSERPVMVIRQGRQVRQWQKIKEHSRNEALDCRVYALAAKAIWQPRVAQLPSLAVADELPDDADGEAAPSEIRPAPAPVRRPQSSFATSWR